MMNKDITLPGLGSFMASAVNRGDHQSAMWAILAMLAVILATDQLVWRPLLAWADNFKIELTESGAPPSSWVYNLLRRVIFSRGSTPRFGSLSPIGYATSRIVFRRVGLTEEAPPQSRRLRRVGWRSFLQCGSAGPFAV